MEILLGVSYAAATGNTNLGERRGYITIQPPNRWNQLVGLWWLFQDMGFGPPLQEATPNVAIPDDLPDGQFDVPAPRIGTAQPPAAGKPLPVPPPAPMPKPMEGSAAAAAGQLLPTPSVVLKSRAEVEAQQLQQTTMPFPFSQTPTPPPPPRSTAVVLKTAQQVAEEAAAAVGKPLPEAQAPEAVGKPLPEERRPDWRPWNSIGGSTS